MLGQMRLPVIATLTLATILSVGIAAPAYAADPVSHIDYSLDASDPQYSGGSIADVGGACTFIDDTALRHYTVEPFHVDVAGVYTPEDRAWLPTGGLLGDGTLAIYTAAPDVSSLGTSCLLGVDDGVYRTVTLDADTTYFLFQSSSAPAAVGSFGFDVTGPGEIAMGAFVPPATSTTLSADPVSAVVGAPIDLTATVVGTGPSGTALSGTVEFFADGSTLGTAPAASGIATLSASTLAVGTHSITAQYSGDAKNAPSTAAALTVTVTAAPVIPAATTTVLTANALSATVGTAIDLSASITGSDPSGPVEFFADGSSLGTAVTDNGVATLSVSALAVGSHSLTARYAGDANNAASTSAAVTVSVTPVATPTPTPSVAPTTAPVAALAETGSNPIAAGFAALLLLAFGGAMLVTRTRRTGASD